MSSGIKRQYGFGPFLLDPSEGRLLRDGNPVTLTPKAFEALVLLVEKRGHLVEKEEMMQSLWPDTFVEEANLAHHIWRLRKALDDTKDDVSYIETVSKRGYRFVAETDEVQTATERAGDLDTATRSDVLPPEEESVPSDNAISDPGRHRSVRSLFPRSVKSLALAAFVFLLALTVIFLGLRVGRSPALDPDKPGITSLAVLPFKHLSSENIDLSLPAGMADGVISRLSNLKALSVRPTSAVIKYTAGSEDLGRVGRELQVDSVLDGTLQMSGDRLRVSVQLVRTQDGKTIWAEHFDERLTNIFQLQDAVSERVARALAIELTGNDVSRLQQRYTSDVEAYQSYLKGRYQMNMAAEGALKAVVSFQDAIGRDQNFALAYAGLADAYSTLGFMGVGANSPRESFENARAAALRALELDDSLADAHTALANILFSYDWRWDEAEKEFVRAIELNPSSAEAHHLYSSYLMAMERRDKALEELKLAKQLDPLSLRINFHYGLCLAEMGRDDEALDQYRKTLDIDANTGGSGSHWGIAMIYLKRQAFDEAIRELEEAQRLDPRPSFRLSTLAEAYALSGKQKEAKVMLDQLLQIGKTEWVSPSGVAMVYAALGDNDQAFTWWNKAVDERETAVVYFRLLSIGDLRSDPRYGLLLARVGL